MKKEETALAVREETTGELATTGAAAEKQYEVQSAIIVARRFPREEDSSYQKLIKAASRGSFAEDAAYSFPRGGATIEGPSVNLAREAARVWGNIRYGLEIIRDDEESRQIRGWAWDLETNTKITAEDDFKKLIYRKSGGWIKPDERDLRELTNRRGAILLRGCILQLIPKDFIEDAMAQCKATLKAGAATDPDSARKKVMVALAEINITPEMIEDYLGHKLSEASPAEIVELRGMCQSIKDGNSTWSEYIKKDTSSEEGPEKGNLNIDDLQPGKSENRGHGKENLGKAATKKTAKNQKENDGGLKEPETDERGRIKMYCQGACLEMAEGDISQAGPVFRKISGYKTFADIPDADLKPVKVKIKTAYDRYKSETKERG